MRFAAPEIQPVETGTVYRGRAGTHRATANQQPSFDATTTPPGAHATGHARALHKEDDRHSLDRHNVHHVNIQIAGLFMHGFNFI